MRKYLIFLFIFPVFLYLSVGAYAAEGDKAVELKMAPDFQLADLNDKTVSLSDYKDKQAVVLFFWTTWCPYCRTELRKLDAESANLAKNSIALLAINVGEPKYKVEDFVKSHNLNFTVLLDRESAVAEIYELLGVPVYFVVNNSGRIVSMGSRFPGDILQELTVKHSQ